MDRFLVLRRLTQLLVVVLFVGTIREAWAIGGRPLIEGNLSASRLLGVLPLADPFATLQILFSQVIPARDLLVGAALVLALYAVLGGRAFCSWVCPVNPISDLAGWVRRKLGLKNRASISRRVRFWILGLTLFLSALHGVAAFELVSPIGLIHRGILFGATGALGAALAIFAAELLFQRGLWCGHLCPLGAFYSLVGRVALLRIAFDPHTCTHCGECKVVCPEAHVLDLVRAVETGVIHSGDCTNCGRCVSSCPEGSLDFGWRPGPPSPPESTLQPKPSLRKVSS